MSLLLRLAVGVFGELARLLLPFFPDLPIELKKAKIEFSPLEFISICIFASLLLQAFTLPFFSFFLSFVFKAFAFGFLFAVSISLSLSALVFILLLNIPKFLIKSSSKRIDSLLPFSTLYLSTLSASKMTLPQILELFEQFLEEGKLREEVGNMVKDIKMLGFDAHKALEREAERSPSEKFREILYGMLAILRSGGDLSKFLREQSRIQILEFRRKLSEFSRKITLMIQIYLISVVISTIFFTILFSIFGGMMGATSNIISLQFFMIVFFLPLISILFLLVIKSLVPQIV